MSEKTGDVRCRGCWALGNNCGLCGHCIATRPPAPPLMSWMLCCNDRHGNFTAQVEQATLEGLDWLAEIEGIPIQARWCGDAERVGFKGEYKAAPEMLKLYGNGRLAVWKHRRNVGNMHWDQVGISVRHSLALLRWLRDFGWQMTAGPSKLFDAFNADRIETADGFGLRMMDALGLCGRKESQP